MLKSRILFLAAASAALALPAAASAASVKLKATLDGASEPAGGDPKASGKFSADVDADSGDLCYTLTYAGPEKPVAAHIHTGAAGANGAPFINLTVSPDGKDLCAATEPDKLKALLAAPEGYYVNVHTPLFPRGAIRAQLSK